MLSTLCVTRMRKHTRTHAHAQIHTHTHTHTLTHTCTHTHTHTRAFRMHACTHACTHLKKEQTHTCTHAHYARTRARMLVHTQKRNKYTNTHINTHIYTHSVDTLSGGSISKVGLFSLGIIPYINASIVLQLLAAAFPALKKLQREEGAQGRARFQYYQKLGSFVFAIVQVRVCINEVSCLCSVTLCAYANSHISITQSRMYTRPHSNTQTHISARTPPPRHTHTHTHTEKHIRTHHILTHTHTHERTHMHANTQTHTCTHVRVRTVYWPADVPKAVCGGLQPGMAGWQFYGPCGWCYGPRVYRRCVRKTYGKGVAVRLNRGGANLSDTH